MEKILIVASGKDSRFNEMLKKHLKSLKDISILDLGEIAPGKDREREREKLIIEATCAVSLLSCDFMASESLMDTSMLLMSRISVFNIVVRPTLWEYSPLAKHPPLLEGAIVDNDRMMLNAVKSIKFLLQGKGENNDL